VRVAVISDMEGTSHIGDVREIVPFCSEYWHSGRDKLTNDVAAAARGLLDGGADEVVVIDNHGPGDPAWPNIVVGNLPEGVRTVEWPTNELPERVDAMFQVGCHARGGSPSFLSHTMFPGLRLRLGAELLSESHWWAWTGHVPVLGIVGSTALKRERGSLSSVPFLAVQDSDDRRTARPASSRPERTTAEIRAFAEKALHDMRSQRSFAPVDFTLETSLQNGDEAAEAMKREGWTRTSRTEFRIEAGAWQDVEDAVEAAIDAAWVPYAFLFDGLDPTSEETSATFAPERRALAEAWVQSWASTQTVGWITPESAVRWEGLDPGQSPS